MIKISGTPPNDLNIYQAQTEQTICVSYVKYYVTLSWLDGRSILRLIMSRISVRIFIHYIISRCHFLLRYHWFRKWLGANQAPYRYINQWWHTYLRIYLDDWTWFNGICPYLQHYQLQKWSWNAGKILITKRENVMLVHRSAFESTQNRSLP